MKFGLAAIFFSFAANSALAAPAKEYFASQYNKYSVEGQKILDGMDIKTGKIELQHGIVLNLPEEFYYLDTQDATEVLEGAWGNPVGSTVNSLGMIFPHKYSPLDEESWGIDLTFDDLGYVSDQDAVGMDFDDLLNDMREETVASNEQRIKDGYGAVTLVGWASPPKYDFANKRLHWAKELNFEGSAGNTLNYNVRFLGRKGVFQMNYIAGMDQLPEINTNLEPVLSLASFVDGSKYSDFNPDIDTVAAIGIGGLIAGKAAAKVGLLALALVFLKKAGFVILLPFAWLMNKFRRKPPEA